uniref:Protein kinase domain-containing protein n=1 Tax=viral metagenome TaxID=1070528 RepID=A0A6C0E9A0_9ZZZZ
MSKRTKKKGHLRSEHVSDQMGGKKLGYGAYGCVISPPAKCVHYPNLRKTEYKLDNNHVSKLINFKHNQSAFLELNIGQKLIGIDPKHHHFSPYFNGCFFSPQQNKDILYLNPDGTNVTSSPLITKISSLSESSESNRRTTKNKNTSLIKSQLNKEYRNKCILNLDNTYLNLIGPYGGSTLTNILSYQKNNDLVAYINNNYWYISIYLIKNIYILYRNKIIHRDIKPSNVTVKFSYINNESIALLKSQPFDSCRVTLIDFGLARELKKNKYSYEEIKDYVSQGTSHYIPIEIFAIRTLIKLIERGYDSNDDSFKTSMVHRVEAKIKRNREYYHHEGIRDETFKYMNNKGGPSNHFITSKKIDKIIDYVIALHAQNKLAKHIDELLYKWDVYSLGIILAKIALKYSIDDKEFISLIFDMIRLDPDKRISIQKLVKHPKYVQYQKFIEKGNKSKSKSIQSK